MFFPSYLVLLLSLAKAEIFEPAKEFLEPSETFEAPVKKEMEPNHERGLFTRMIGTQSASCAGRCNESYNSADYCHCDNHCAGSGDTSDCCTDYTSLCTR